MKLPPVVILAGGLATRLYPMTHNIPKSMVEIAGKPFIHYQLLMLKNGGISDVLLCIGNLGYQIRDYVGDGSKWGIRVMYSNDSDKLLGTGGAIKKALPNLPSVFFIVYGDSYLNVDFAQVMNQFKDSNKLAILTIYHNKNNFDRSNIAFKNGEILEYSKVQSREMEYIDYGLSILNKKIFNYWPDGVAFDLGDVYKKLILSKEMCAFEATKRFYEIGSPKGLEEFKGYINSIHTG
jgi:NDP-sugar pyrophosphorylase family protein